MISGNAAGSILRLIFISMVSWTPSRSSLKTVYWQKEEYVEGISVYTDMCDWS